jgi:DNA-binding transcriptional LysR family regulator
MGGLIRGIKRFDIITRAIMPILVVGSRRGDGSVKNIDLKLLAVIGELSNTRSVSQTAENLMLSQSAVSMSLAKLRKHFNDPLFVRTSTGMDPTPYARELIAELRRAEEILQTALERRIVFDPTISNRMFHICSTDLASFSILPKLLQKLRTVAPAVRVDLRLIAKSTPRMLESGEVDLAIGLLSQMGAGFCQQRLFEGQFVCAMRADHPRIKNQLTLKQFEEEIHVAVPTPGTGYPLLKRALEDHKVQRIVGVRVPSFLGVAGIIGVTDYLAIVPKKVGGMLAQGRNMTLLPLPFPVPPYTVTQVWHERYNLDPPHQWLRGAIASMFRNEPQTSGDS